MVRNALAVRSGIAKRRTSICGRGRRWAEWINAQEGAERAVIQPARAPLPTITALGMGLALPLRETDLRADVVGTEWRLIEVATETNLSIAEERRGWLRDHGIVPADGMLTLAQTMQGDIPAPAKGRTRLLITDDIIDQLGHDDELELLGSTIALERYRDVVIRLRDAGWQRILVVTDHGFIHWPGSEEKRAAPPVAGSVYRSRRALAYPASIDLPGPYALSLGEQLKFLPARGASCWSAYGGLGYFHGGASLQEWVIPCVKIEWRQKAQPVNVTIQPPTTRRPVSGRPYISRSNRIAPLLSRP